MNPLAYPPWARMPFLRFTLFFVAGIVAVASCHCDTLASLWLLGGLVALYIILFLLQKAQGGRLLPPLLFLVGFLHLIVSKKE